MKGNLIELDAELDSEVLLEEVNSLLEKYKWSLSRVREK
jgi:hypothetical protein